MAIPVSFLQIRTTRTPHSRADEVVCSKKQKNISRNSMGHQVGQIHLGKQSLDSLQTRKGKALRGGKKRKFVMAPAPPSEALSMPTRIRRH